MSSAAEDQPLETAAAAPAPDPAPAGECPEGKPQAKAEAASGSAPATEEPEPALPPLSPAEFRQYNRLAEQMDYFHDHFRRSWTLLWNAATSARRPGGMSLKQFIDEGLHFLSYLETHHSIEETYVFPVLARKMPEFRTGSEGAGGKKKKGGGGAAELLRQHQEIHAGMDVLEGYLTSCRRGETELEMGTLKEKMEGWGGVLWKHLDQEVKTLGAENMRKYWTLEEIRRIPM